MSPPILNPAPTWRRPRSEYLILYHGCTTPDKDAIERRGVDVLVGRVDADFGRGFYTTTLEGQARQWAWSRYYHPRYSRLTGYQPVVLRFRVRRHDLAGLQSLHFVLGDYDSEDYWSLVQHCRQSTRTTLRDHSGPVTDASGNRWYDLVAGPVAAMWRQRVAMTDADQCSFHTAAGTHLLTALVRSGRKADYGWFVVT